MPQPAARAPRYEVCCRHRRHVHRRRVSRGRRRSAARENPDHARRSERRRVACGRASWREHGASRRSSIARFVHGTTVATNAVLERKGARIGLITTAGLQGHARDRPPEPARGLQRRARSRRRRCSSRRARCGAKCRERVSAAGEVLVPLDEAAVRREVASLAAAGRAGDRVSFPVLLPQSGARAPGGGDRPRACIRS